MALDNKVDMHVHVIDKGRSRIAQAVHYPWFARGMRIALPGSIEENMTVSEVYMNQQKVEEIKCPVCGTTGSSAPAPCPRCALVDELIEELIRRQTRETRWPVARPKSVLPVRRGSLGLVGATGLEPVTLSFEG